MMFSKIFDDGDAGYVIGEVSDDEGNASSSDEDNGDLIDECVNSRTENDTNDFLTEMNKELNETVAKVEEKSNLRNKKRVEGNEQSKASTSQDKKESEQKFYDDIYFDSDDSDEEISSDSKRKKKKHPVISNDDLFYDPDIDDEDQKWIDDYRRKCRPPPTNVTKPQPLPSSDAVLNCPACMSLLCLDCQRHDVYSTQYRAMFVQNCTVNFTETLNYPSKSRKHRKHNKSDASRNDEIYHPVNCNVCNTEVAVYDKDEVYHFFNVLSSYS